MADDIKPVADKATGIGWCGIWMDGTPGWCLSDHINDGIKETIHDQKSRAYVQNGDRFYRCKVTVELIRDKNGKHVTKRVRKDGA